MSNIRSHIQLRTIKLTIKLTYMHIKTRKQMIIDYQICLQKLVIKVKSQAYTHNI